MSQNMGDSFIRRPYPGGFTRHDGGKLFDPGSLSSGPGPDNEDGRYDGNHDQNRDDYVDPWKVRLRQDDDVTCDLCDRNNRSVHG